MLAESELVAGPINPVAGSSGARMERPQGGFNNSLPLGKVRCFRMDPRTKLLALLLINNFAFDFNTVLLHWLSVIVVTFLLATRVRWSSWIKFVIAIPLLQALAVFIDGLFPYAWVGLLTMFLRWFTHFMVVGAIAVYVFTSTRISEFTAALTALRLPRAIVVPFSVMLRFIPTVVQELMYISQAMRLRGVWPGAWGAISHPAQTAEYIVVPLLASSTRMSDDLSASGLIRGLGRRGHRSCVTRLGFGVTDLTMVLVLLVLLAVQVTRLEIQILPDLSGFHFVCGNRYLCGLL